MSRRRRTDPRRGRHKKRTSPETRSWERDHLIPPRPGYMSAATYRELAELRRSLPA